MQVDYATSCHTPPLSVFKKLSSAARLRPSHSNKYRYSEKPIRPIGKVIKLTYGELTLQNIEISSNRFSAHPGKPAPLSGSDSKGVFLQNNEHKPNQPHIHI